MSDPKATSAAAQTVNLLKKKLLLESKKRQLLAEKQTKTLEALRVSKQALGSVKEDLLKYKTAYVRLRKQQAGQTDTGRTSALESEVARLESDLSKAQERMSKTLALLKESKEEAKDARARLREVERTQRMEIAPSSDDTRLLQAKREIAKLQDEVQAARDEARQSAEEIAERDSEIASLQGQLSERSSQLASAARSGHSEGELAAAQLESAQRALAKEVETSNALMVELESANAEIARLDGELSQAKASLATAESSRQQQTEKLLELAATLNQLQDSHSRNRTHDSEEIEELRRRISEQQAELELKQRDFDELSANLDETEKLQATLSKEHEETLLKLWDLEERLKSGDSEQGALVGALESEITELKTARTETQQQISELEKALSTARREAAQASTPALVKPEEFEEAQTRIADLEMRLLTLSGRLDEESAKALAANSAKEALSVQVASLKEALAQSKLSRPPGALPESSASPDGRVKQLEEQLMETRTRLLSFHNEMDEVDQARLQALARVTEQDRELAEKDQLLAASHAQVGQIENLVSMMEQKEKTAEHQLQAMRQQLAEMLEENMSLKEENQNQSARIQAAERASDNNDEKISLLRRRQENTVESLERAKEELTEARTRALQAMARSDEAEKKSRAAAEEIKSMRRKLDRLQERVAELEMLG